MTELDLVARIRRWAGRHPAAGLVRGIGDDCAIVRPRGAADWLLTTDLMIEDVHFRRSTAPDALGHKALARGLSDIAAMGGRPRWCLLSLALPAWAGPRWVGAFYKGLLGLARRTQTALIGGDVSRAAKAACDIVVVGDVPRGRALRRDGARPGDRLFVSGALGRPWRKHPRPEPRLALGRYLRQSLRATSAMDLSDGLSIDLHRLCLESNVAASIVFPLPVYPGAGLDAALHGGEDYELLFTVRRDAKVPARHAAIPLTEIGSIRRGRPGDVRLFGRRLEPGGWDHFRRT